MHNRIGLTLPTPLTPPNQIPLFATSTYRTHPTVPCVPLRNRRLIYSRSVGLLRIQKPTCWGYCLRPFLTGPLFKSPSVYWHENSSNLVCSSLGFMRRLGAVSDSLIASNRLFKDRQPSMKPTRCQSVLCSGDTNGDTSVLKLNWITARI